MNPTVPRSRGPCLPRGLSVRDIRMKNKLPALMPLLNAKLVFA